MKAGARVAAPTIRTRSVPEPCWQELSANLHPVLRRVLAARAVQPGQLSPSLANLVPVGELPGVREAVDRLLRARLAGERIIIVGDFDADGATATAVMMNCLAAFGFADTGFLVPSRFEYGYGLSVPVAELAAADGPGLLVTVDNGISSLDGVRRAQDLGMTVIVTDHHLPGPSLPQSIIVSPCLPGTEFPSPSLCGVGVAFYVMAALGRRLADDGIVDAVAARRAVTDCLDLVALGTVADLVRLDFNNRILVAEGLRRIRAGRTRSGIRALFEVGGRDIAWATAGDLGFSIAPRLNAAGRLDDMTVGIHCLLATDESTATALAGRLHALNLERRELQARMEDEARDLLASSGAAGDGFADGLCLFDERWHQGVVGLVASRIREQTGRPAIAFARAGEAGMLRGSARSVPGVHIRDVMAAAIAQMSGAAIRFGGHAMAAGITLAESQLSAFSGAFAAALEVHRDILAAPDFCWTDGALGPEDFGLNFADTLAAAGPWGQGFPEPLFDNTLLVLDQRVIGEKHLRLRVRHPDGGGVIDAVAFNRGPLVSAGGSPVRCVYRLDVNVFRGTRRAQLVVEHLDCD